MNAESNVFIRNAKKKDIATSKRSRLIAFLLSFIVPVGSHNYYLGNYIKGITQTFIAIALLMFVPPGFLVILLPFYFAWMTNEGLYYLLYGDVKDGDGFPMYEKNNPPKPKQRNAILMAFLFPFGIHNIYLGRLKFGFIVWGYTAVILSVNLIFQIIPVLYLSWYLILVAVLVSWIDGIMIIVKGR